MKTTIHLLASQFYQESITQFISQPNYIVDTINCKNMSAINGGGYPSGHIYLIETNYLIKRNIATISPYPILLLGNIKHLYRIFDFPLPNKGGYIAHVDSIRVLPGAINCVLRSNWYVSPSVKSFLEGNKLLQQQNLLKWNIKTPLTTSELEILFEIAKGNTTSKIAKKRYRSIHTVKTQRKQIRKKINLTSHHNLNVLAAQKMSEIKTLYRIHNNFSKVHEILQNTT